jgi:hypothetical protein
MHKYKQLISLGIVFLGSMNFLNVAQAQDPSFYPLWDANWREIDRIERERMYGEESSEESSSDPLQYGAISRSHDTRRYGWVWGYDDYEAATNAAVQECGVSDCSSSSLFFGNGYGAIAATSDHWTVHEADTPEEAAQDALEDCQYLSDIPDTCEVILVVGSKEGTIFQK